MVKSNTILLSNIREKKIWQFQSHQPVTPCLANAETQPIKLMNRHRTIIDSLKQFSLSLIFSNLRLAVPV